MKSANQWVEIRNMGECCGTPVSLARLLVLVQRDALEAAVTECGKVYIEHRDLADKEAAEGAQDFWIASQRGQAGGAIQCEDRIRALLPEDKP